MTADQLLKMMKDPEEMVVPEGVCIRYVWQWTVNGEPVTRAVNTLIRRGKAKATYYRNSASLNVA